MAGQYLRTNWRVTPEALQPQAIAGLVAKGSGQNSIGLYSPNGDVIPNLVIFSWSADIGGDGALFITINACSMLSAAFGGSAVSMFPYGTSGVGFKILPIGIMTRRIHAYSDGAATSGSQGGLWFSICASDDSGVNFLSRCMGSISSASASFHAVITGFIVSTP